MPKSYEEAQEEKNEEEHAAGHEEDSPSRIAGEVDDEFEGDSLEEMLNEIEDISTTVPEWLRPERSQIPEEPSRRRPGDMPDFGFGIGELDELGLLEVIARIQIAQLSSLFDIAAAVEPLKGIVISGTNAISSAETAEPVVPESDETDIATRRLFLKASDDNNKDIYFGDDEVAPETGFSLAPGEGIELDIDLRLQVLWMASADSGQQVDIIGLV